jgi:DNA-directed RNA polymerase specialized sigma24 family protein
MALPGVLMNGGIGLAVMPGELRGLLDRCRSEESLAWEAFTAWTRSRAAAILRAIGKLSRADREDIVAATLNQLFRVVRHDGISGNSDAEIHAYVRTTIRNQALNLLRARAQSLEAAEQSIWESHDGEPQNGEVTDERPSQDARAIVSEQLGRVQDLLQSWAAADRYLFLAKVNGVPARTIQQTLARPPFETRLALATVNTRFHRLRRCLMSHLEQP